MSRAGSPSKSEFWSAQAMFAPSTPEAVLPAEASAKRGFAETRREHGFRTPYGRGAALFGN